MAGLDVMHLDESWKTKIVKKIMNGTATDLECLAYKKYMIEKQITEELDIDSIITVVDSKRAVRNVCNLLKIPPEERDNYHIIHMDSRLELDFMCKDHVIQNKLDNLLRHLGYSGVNDRTTKVDVTQVDDDKTRDSLRQIM